jgi:hypothetical protein
MVLLASSRDRNAAYLFAAFGGCQAGAQTPSSRHAFVGLG